MKHKKGGIVRRTKEISTTSIYNSLSTIRRTACRRPSQPGSRAALCIINRLSRTQIEQPFLYYTHNPSQNFTTTTSPNHLGPSPEEIANMIDIEDFDAVFQRTESFPSKCQSCYRTSRIWDQFVASNFVELFVGSMQHCCSTHGAPSRSKMYVTN